MHEKASLNASKSRGMSDNGVVSDGQRGVESHEIGGKVGKDSGQKTRNGNNLARQNDAKSII